MPLLYFFDQIGGQLARKNLFTSVPLSFLLLGLQAMMNVQFSCPCKFGWSQVVSFLILCVPTLFAFVIMLLLLRPFQFKCSCSQIEHNSGEAERQQINKKTEGQWNNGRDEEQEKNGGDEVQQISGGSQSEESKQTFETALVSCLIPSLVWICIFFIDGDYLACLATNWNGRYACDNELHPNCLNWCKPTELSQGKNETEQHEKTQLFINISQITGYFLAGGCCIFAIVILFVIDRRKKRFWNIICCAKRNESHDTTV